MCLIFSHPLPPLPLLSCELTAYGFSSLNAAVPRQRQRGILAIAMARARGSVASQAEPAGLANVIVSDDKPHRAFRLFIDACGEGIEEDGSASHEDARGSCCDWMACDRRKRELIAQKIAERARHVDVLHPQFSKVSCGMGET